MAMLHVKQDMSDLSEVPDFPTSAKSSLCFLISWYYWLKQWISASGHNMKNIQHLHKLFYKVNYIILQLPHVYDYVIWSDEVWKIKTQLILDAQFVEVELCSGEQ